MNLNGKKILLTGATGSIGGAIAQKLASSGASLVITGRNSQKLWEVFSSFPGKSHEKY